MPLSASEIWTRFALAAAVTTFLCLITATVLLFITGVPRSYPPLSPLPIVSGTVGGALLVTLGYWFLSAIIRDPKTLNLVFFTLGILLLIASFHLPYRLSYTQSPRFAGVTLAAQVGQGLLHTMVVVLSMICFLRR